jgi:hypothetical protein
LQTELNGPHFTGVRKIQTFKLTQNDPTPFVENTIFIELGSYCSHHCINTVEATVDVLRGVTCTRQGGDTIQLEIVEFDFESNLEFRTILVSN